VTCGTRSARAYLVLHPPGKAFATARHALAKGRAAAYDPEG